MDSVKALSTILWWLMMLIIHTDSIHNPYGRAYPHPSVNIRHNSFLQPIRTLLIDNYDSYTYNLWQLLAEVNGIEPLVVYNDAFGCSWERLLHEVPAFDNIVLSPGPGSPENPADFGLCHAAILQARVPLLGVCLGHQGLAYTYGGRVVRAAEAMHGRLSSLQHDRSGLFRGQPQQIKVVRYHSLSVEENSLPSELAVSARSSDGTVMALTHRFKPQYGLQFHPESILTQQGRRYMENFRDITRSHGDQRARDTEIPHQLHPSPSLSPCPTKRRYVFARQISRSPGSPSSGIEPVDVFEALFSSRPAAFFLDSGARAAENNDEENGEHSAGQVREKGMSYFGVADCEDSHVLEYWGRDNLLRRCSGRSSEQLGVNLFQHLRALLAEERDVKNFPLPSEESQGERAPLWNFTAKYFGYLGYELGREAEALLSNPRPSWNSNVNLTSPTGLPAHRELPLAVLMFPRTYIAYNHSSETYSVVSFSDIFASRDEDKGVQDRVQAHGAALYARLEAFLRSKSRVSNEPNVGPDAAALRGDPARPILTATKSRAEYISDIHKALEYIRRGETYEVCLTAQFRGPLPELPPPMTDTVTDTEQFSAVSGGRRSWHLYRTLRSKNPAPYACYIHYDPSHGRIHSPDDLTWCPRHGISICSSSPERYLRIDQNGRMSSKPIKGTARRDLSDVARDRELRLALSQDEKARAENLMIVDLVRNDFGRVCTVGSVEVTHLMAVETYATVHQMVSTIEGSLRPQFDAVDAIVATFPGGSMTGAPKKRTMQILRELESIPGKSSDGDRGNQGSRGVYSGAVGYIALDGRLDLSIIIRTALVRNESVSVGAGGAIIALSDPDQEADEVLLKARSAAGAIGCDVRFAADCKEE